MSQFKLKYRILAIILLFFSLSVQSKKFQWTNVSQEQYINNLVECKNSLDELQWSKNIWPMDNKKPKPNYAEIKKIEKIRQSVHKNLKMQQLLLDEFNFEISVDMLQSDLHRMANNTNDSNHLRQMFAVLDNDPNTIAQCISRPYLVEKNFTKFYNLDQTIHAQTKSNAQLDLNRFRLNQDKVEIDAEVFTIIYKLKSDDEKSLNQNPTDKMIVELDQEHFNHKLKLLGNTQIQEQESAFIHTEIREQTKDSLVVQILKWQKQKKHTWLQSKSDAKFTIKDHQHITHKYSLPKITGSMNQFNHNATTADTWYNTFDPRQSHTAVWTGSEMIVWGGFNESGFLNTGGRYNPSNDSWVATSIGINVPIARVEHTAIWTGTEMIIWGGIDETNNYLGTGSRYDPVDDSWITTSTGIDAPLGRSDHTVIWTGTEMIIWGGVLPGNILTQTGARYNPSNDSWSPTNIDANVPSQRTAHTAIWTGTEMIIWGGRDSIDTINTGGRYNPVSNTWETTKLDSSTPQGKFSHSAVWTGTEMIIFGGFVYEFFVPAMTNTGGRYNPVDDTWINTNHQTIARAGHFAFWTGTEMIVLSEPNDVGNRGSIYSPTFDSWIDITDVGLVYNYRVSSSAIFTGTDIIIWGGNIDNTSEGSTGMTNTGNRYNLDSNTWTVTGFGINVPSFRQKHTAIWTGTEMIIWGGNDGPFFEGLLNTGSRYNPASNVWTEISDGINVPSARSLHTAIWTGTEMIVWGGIGSDSLLNSGGRYNPLSDSWLATSTDVNVPSQRAYHTTVWTGEEMIIWGGNNLNTGNINTGGRYNPSDDSWVSTNTGANVPSIRLGQTAVWTGDEMIIWGGNDGSNINVLLNTGGRYNPTSNSWLPTSLGTNVPTERVGHTAVWTGTEMIVWGGGSSTGGRYNPISGNWLATSTGTNVPSIRTNHSAIWTGEEMIIWGGDDLNTGGRYYPSDDSWLPTSIANAPTGRSNYSVIYTGTSMIIWGGQVLQIANNTLGIYYVKSSYDISGTLSGLNGDQVILQNNGGDDLTLTTDGNFTFETAIIEGNDYAVTVLTNPSIPNQNCTVSNGTGVDIMTNVTNIQVSCINIYNVLVTVTGLDPTNSIEVTTNGQTLDFTGPGGPTVFGNPLNEGDDYAVLVTENPTNPNQICSVTGGENGDGTGTISGNDVSITVECVTIKYDVNITVSGLANSNTISFANGADNQTFMINGTQTISNLDDLSSFNVSISSAQPDTPNQTCGFNNANSGNLAGIDYEVLVDCVTEQYFIGGISTGLVSGNPVTVSLGNENLNVDSNTFIFNNPIDDESSYSIDLTSEPTSPSQSCLLINATGTINGSDVDNVEVNCQTRRFSIGGNLFGLHEGGIITMSNNNSDDLMLMSDGEFTFNTTLLDLSEYDVSISMQPNSPIQTCSVNLGMGNLAGSDISNIEVSCLFGDDLIFYGGFDSK